MKKLLFTLIFLLLSFPLTVNAQIQVTELNELPKGQIIEDYTVSPVDDLDDELMPTWAVREEVYHLQKTIPLLNIVDWNVHVINQQINIPCFNLDVPLAGYARRNPEPIIIFLFASPNTTEYTAHYMVSHEIGHLVRYKFISQTQLEKYVKMRSDGKNHNTYYDSSEELFAEDFRWLFGSEDARYDYDYQPTYPKPGEKEREWILSKLSQAKLTWKEKLDLHKYNRLEGYKEILRIWRYSPLILLG